MRSSDSSDVFVTGGLDVFTAEIEAVLERHPDVAEVAVVGVPDDHLGEVGRAVVVAKPGRRIDTRELERLARTELATFKVPREWVVRDEARPL